MLLGLIIGAALRYFYGYSASRQTLHIKLDMGAKVQLYKLNNLNSVNDDNLIEPNITSEQDIKVAKGWYKASADAFSFYSNFSKQFYVGDKKAEVEVSPAYSSEKLGEMLALEQPAIAAEISKKYPVLPQAYSIQQQKLYDRGEWFAARILSSDANSDSYSIVMQKDNNTWKVITDPPDIIISTSKYPVIPSYILQDINKF